MLKKIFKKNKKEFKGESLPLSRDEKKELSNYYEAVKNIEKDSILEEKKAKTLFQRCFIATLVVCLIEGIVIAVMLPLETTKIVVLNTDKHSGYTEQAVDLKDVQKSYDEVNSKYWLNAYVSNYESYDWETIQNMSDTIKLMSDDITFNKYDYNIKQPISPLNLFKDTRKIVTRVRSVNFLGKDYANVRFSKYVIEKSGAIDRAYPITNWIATIKFDYSKKIQTEKERLINPFGFRVISYKIDVEGQ